MNINKKIYGYNNLNGYKFIIRESIKNIILYLNTTNVND